MYDLFRRPGAPTLYAASKTPASHDVLLLGIFYCGLVLFVSFLVILPGYRGYKALFYLVRMFTGLFILISIVVCNFGSSWETAEVTSYVPYRAGIGDHIKADITVYIALRGINITLKSNPERVLLANGRFNETINYNERFSWNNEGWTAGQGAYGSSDGLFNIDFRAAKETGKPIAILSIAEYFVLDGGDFRWGRYYRDAGFYIHGLLWLALPMWLLGVMTFYTVLPYGAYFSLATGCLLVIASIIYKEYRPRRALIIPFEEGSLEFHVGWCFILCLFTGMLCIVIGIVVVYLDEKSPETLRTFFDIDIGLDEEEEVVRLPSIGDVSQGDFIRPSINVVECEDFREEGAPRDRLTRIRRIHHKNTIGSIKLSLTKRITGPRLTSSGNHNRTPRVTARGKSVKQTVGTRDSSFRGLQPRSPSSFRSKHSNGEENFAADCSNELSRQKRQSLPEEVILNFPEDNNESSPKGANGSRAPICQSKSLPLSDAAYLNRNVTQVHSIPGSHLSRINEASTDDLDESNAGDVDRAVSPWSFNKSEFVTGLDVHDDHDESMV